jgi:pyridoxal phosphate enzyme (YggS family)
MAISQRIAEICETIETIRKNCGLKNEVFVMAAVKQREVYEIEEAFDAGLRYFGENRVQEAEDHLQKLDPKIRENIRYHFIGRLQSNKAKRAVKMFDSIDSVDSIKIAKEIDKFSSEINEVKDIMIEINLGEEQKGGAKIDEIDPLLEMIFSLKNIRLTGLMAVPPFFEDPEKSRPFFRKMYKLFEQVKTKHPNPQFFKYLSMGMSNDYKAAIEEGSNMVRIGTLIFGARR